MSQVYTWSELKHHNKPNDLYIVIQGHVYNVTDFQNEHPGGPEFLLDQGGGDVTELFEDAGHSGEARSLLKKLKIGVVKDKVVNKKETSLNKAGNGSPGGFEFRRYASGVFFFLLIGLFLHYYIQNSSEILSMDWQELIAASSWNWNWNLLGTEDSRIVTHT